MGRPSAPAVDWPFAEKWQALASSRNARVAMGVFSWLVAFVIALFAESSDSETPIPQSVRYVVVLATPVLLVARPRLGCAVAVVSAALLGIAGEPPLVVVPFAVNAVFCAYFLTRFLIEPLRQRRLFAQFAAPVSIELLTDDLVCRRPLGVRAIFISCLLVLVAGFSVWAWFGDPRMWLWAGTVAFVVAVQAARVAATWLAARRLTSRPDIGAQVLVRFGRGMKLELFTADKYRQQFAWLSPRDVVYQSADAEAADVRAAVAAIDDDNAILPPDDLFPATVVGDFRVGGYVAILIDHVLVLPGGPVRTWPGGPPIEVPPGLLDGRQWSGIMRPDN